jgi:hypothetical protein
MRPARARTSRCAETVLGVGQAGRQCRRGRRLLERAQHSGAARAEEEVEARVVRLGRGRGELGGPAGLVAEPDGATDLVVGEQHAAGEDERDQHEGAALEVQVEGLVELDHGAAPAHAGVELLEHRLGAGHGQRAGAAEHVALEYRSQPRPVVGERGFPIGVEAVGETIEHLVRPGEERVPRRRRVVPVGVGDVEAHDVELGGADALELIVDACGRLVGDRCEEVGDVLGAPEGVGDRPELHAPQRVAGAHDPLGVLELGLMLVQHADAGDGLPKRAKGQARVGEVAVVELDADHAPRR